MAGKASTWKRTNTTMNMKQYEKTKASAIQWQEMARQAYIDGDMVKQALYHEYMAHDMIFMVIMEEGDSVPTVPYMRYGDDGKVQQMVSIGPHQVVQKTHHAKTATRANADDPKELQEGEQGIGG